MKAVIIDPGLLNDHGHHFHTDLAVYRELEARGIGATILGHRRVEPVIRAALPVRPVFRSPAYPKRDGLDQGGHRANFEVFNHWVAEDLIGADVGPLAGEDLVLIPTARDIHLSGIYEWYVRLPEPRPMVCARLMFLPGFRLDLHEKELAADLARKQLNAWKGINGSRLILASESRELSEYYESLCGLVPIAFPIIVRCPERRCPERPRRMPGAPEHFIFIGEARREKGVHLIAPAFRELFKNHPDFRLTVQTSCLYDVDETLVEDLRDLSPRVALQTKPLNQGGYDDCITSADVVLLPYDIESYRRRTSLIFLEAVEAGIPVLTTAGTWMQRETASLGLGHVFMEAFTSEALVAGVENLVASWPEVVNRAGQSKDAIKARHNPSRFVDALLAECQKLGAGTP